MTFFRKFEDIEIPLELVYHTIPKGQNKKILPKFLEGRKFPKIPHPRGHLSINTLLRDSFIRFLSENYEVDVQIDGDEHIGKDVSKTFLKKYPPKKITSISIFRYGVLITKTSEEKIFVQTYTGPGPLSENTKEFRLLKLNLCILGYEHKVNKIGILFLWKRENPLIVRDFSEAREVLDQTKKPLIRTCSRSLTLVQSWPELYNKSFVGHHVRKEAFGQILASSPEKSKPFQVFLLGNMGKKGEDIALDSLGKEYEESFTLYRGYVHAPYSLSLARKNVSKYPGAPSIASAGKKYLEIAHKMGLKGVVFHIDKSPDLDQALENVKQNIDSLLESTSEECPILLENSCGEGNGFMSTPKELRNLLLEYPTPKVRMCLDICHAHGAGYDTMEYISVMCSNPKLRKKIGLIHLNGAYKPKGCHADGHAYVGRFQRMNLQEIEYILDYAEVKKIDCIIE